MTEPLINLEENIGKVVGKRTKAPVDPFKTGMDLQTLSASLHRSLKHRWAAKGVYRFASHEEADEWMWRMLAQSQIPKT